MESLSFFCTFATCLLSHKSHKFTPKKLMADYYATAFRDFKDLGLDDAANQVLKEGLTAYPMDDVLLSLAKSRGISQGDEVNGKQHNSGYVSESGDLGQLLFGMMQSQAPSIKVRNVPEPERIDLEVPNASNSRDLEMEGTVFWQELQKKDLTSILLEHGGLIRVSNLLPEPVALNALETLQNLPNSDWSESNSSAYQDEGEFGDKSAKHKFSRYDGDRLDEIIGRIRSMSPNLFPSFQAAKYESGGNLSAHDDSNYFVVAKTDKNQSQSYPSGSLLFRKIAVIYYLTKDWKKDNGGSLMDLHHAKDGLTASASALVPRFNSMVAFLVPRLHQVEELAAGAPPRFSVFGWFSDDRPYPPANELRRMPWLSTLA